MASNASYKKQSATFNNTTYNFPAFPIDSQHNVFFFLKAAGSSIAGTFKIQCSPNGEDWVDVTSATATISAAGNLYINVPYLAANLVRPVVISSNTNALTAEVWGFAKQ